MVYSEEKFQLCSICIIVPNFFSIMDDMPSGPTALEFFSFLIPETISSVESYKQFSALADVPGYISCSVDFGLMFHELSIEIIYTFSMVSKGGHIAVLGFLRIGKVLGGALDRRSGSFQRLFSFIFPVSI